MTTTRSDVLVGLTILVGTALMVMVSTSGPQRCDRPEVVLSEDGGVITGGPPCPRGVPR